MTKSSIDVCAHIRWRSKVPKAKPQTRPAGSQNQSGLSNFIAQSKIQRAIGAGSGVVLVGASFLKLPKVYNIIRKICVTSADEPAGYAEEQKKQAQNENRGKNHPRAVHWQHPQTMNRYPVRELNRVSRHHSNSNAPTGCQQSKH
jgi:hypothetical protein